MFSVQAYRLMWHTPFTHLWQLSASFCSVAVVKCRHIPSQKKAVFKFEQQKPAKIWLKWGYKHISMYITGFAFHITLCC